VAGVVTMTTGFGLLTLGEGAVTATVTVTPPAPVDQKTNVTTATNVTYAPGQTMGLVRISLVPTTATGGGTFQIYGDSNGINIPIPVYDSNGYLISQVGKVNAVNQPSGFFGGSALTVYVDGSTFTSLFIVFAGFTGGGGYFSIVGSTLATAYLKSFPATLLYVQAYGAVTTPFGLAVAGCSIWGLGYELSGTPGAPVGAWTLKDSVTSALLRAGWDYTAESSFGDGGPLFQTAGGSDVAYTGTVAVAINFNYGLVNV